MADTATPVANSNALDAADLPLSDYRSLREGRAVEPVVADAPPETEAETAPDSEPGDDTEEPKQQDASKQPAKKTKQEKFNGRFSELTGQIKDLQRQLAAKNGTGPATPSAPSPSAPPSKPADAAADVEPDPEKYTDYNAYQRDQIKYEIRQAEKAKADQSRRQEAAQAEHERASRWTEQVAAAKATRADFDAVALNPNLPVSTVMAAAITDSEVGASILLHLGEHPDLALKISQMSEVGAVRAIGKIEAALEAAKSSAADDPTDDEDDADAPGEDTPPTPKPISRAPKPVRALTGGRASSSPNPARNIEGMSQHEYRELRESGKLR